MQSDKDEYGAMRMGARALRRCFASLGNGPVLDAEEMFPEHVHLLNITEQLRADVHKILKSGYRLPRFHDILESQTPLSANDGKNWHMYVVKSFGHDIKQNASRLPSLQWFLVKHPNVLSAAISILESGKSIPAHRGAFRGILRYHLCLFAGGSGDDRAVLSLAGETYAYTPGDWLLWDDTFEHSVVNKSSVERIVLLLDVRRKDLPLHLRLLANVYIAIVRFSTQMYERRVLVQ